MGRWDAALEVYHRALPAVRSSGDRQAMALLLGNRGVVQVHLGRAREAESDFLEADALLAALGSGLHRAITAHNLGYVAALRGEVPLALARYDDAHRGYAQHREVPLELWLDRSELLLAAGLASEGRTAAHRAVDAAAARHEPAELAEAQVRLAQAALADGDPATAQRVAEEAARTLQRQRRPGWVALAQWTRLRGCLALDPSSVPVGTLARAADRLEKAGWHDSALQARLQAGIRAQGLGRAASARQHLEVVSRARRGGPVWHRHLGWHAEALLREGAGDRTGALHAVARGLDVAEEHRATLGATDLRVGASNRVAALAAVGLRLAVEGGRPAAVLRWAERTRAIALLRPPVRPSDDEETEGALAELRTAVRLRRAAAASGRPDPDLVRRQAALEQRVLEIVRRRGGDGVSAHPALDLEFLLGALGDRALVEYAVVDGRLLAVVAAGGRLRVRRLGDAAPVAQEMQHLLFALRRMATTGHRPALRSRLDAAAARIDAGVLAPLAVDIGDRDLVVVPTEPLHTLPWSVLASCRGRAVSVAPSASLWLAADSRPAPAAGRTVLAAGPGLVHAEVEVKELAELHPGATVFTGEQARVTDILTAMAGAQLVHLAAHGRFRADNPQFSALELADGPLTGHDVERLPQAPVCAVLSACETGTTAAMAGGELLGLAASLLSIGVRTVVAPLLQVPDAETAPLMVELHRGLRAGRPVSAALAAAVERAAAGSDAEAATGAAFICVGA
jgi:tetratricopeptide (TPR) repeat protein